METTYKITKTNCSKLKSSKGPVGIAQVMMLKISKREREREETAFYDFSFKTAFCLEYKIPEFI